MTDPTPRQPRSPGPTDSLPSPDLPFDALVSSTRLDDARFRWLVPDGWQQGRGAFGGLVLGALVRALEVAAGPDRPLRSLTAELPGPTLPGPSELEVELLRAGSGVTTLAVRLEQGGAVQAHAVGVFGRARSTDGELPGRRPPPRPHWRELERAPVEPPLGPPFARFFDFWNVGAVPSSSTPDATVSGWVRPRHAGRCDAAWAIACVDAWWPALSARFDAPRPVGTLAFTAQLVGALDALKPANPVFCTGRDVAVRDGFATELRELITEDGALLMTNQQTIALIR